MSKKSEHQPSFGSTAGKKDQVTVGEDTGKTSPQQAAEARNEKAKDKTDNTVDRHALSVVEENLSPEQKRSDAIVEARHKHYAKIGTDYIEGEIGGSGKPKEATWKKGEVKERKKYAGWVTVTGVSGEDGREISYRFYIPEDQPVTEEGVRYRFQKYHDSAMREPLKIDTDNKDDPLLATAKG